MEQAESAAKSDVRFEENVAALEAAIPTPLKVAEIDVQIGARWIDPKFYNEFMYETFGTPVGFT